MSCKGVSKMSYAHGPTDKPLLGETIGQNLLKTTKTYPDHEALVAPVQNVRLTYRQLWEQTTIIAKSLLAKGIQRGDRVGIWGPNRCEWVLVQYAVMRIGAVLVNLNPAYQLKELIFCMNQCDMKMVVSATEQRKGIDCTKTIHQVKSKVPSLEHVVLMEPVSWEDFLSCHTRISDEDLHAAEAAPQFDDPVNLQYTSGTTGFPKGVTLSHHNVLNNAFFIGERLHYTAADRVCIPVPFFHCFGMVIGNLACTTHGATMVIPNESFDPALTLQTVQDEKCTSLYGVPTMFIAELQLPNFNTYDLKSLRTGVMAGSVCPIETMKQVQSKMFMKEVTICYGMTETSPVSTMTVIGTPLEKQVKTVGTVQDHLEIKIVDPVTGDIVPRGVEGEFCTRGYSIMLKYWNAPEATNAVIDSARWMHTGDKATMDEDGYVTITGRIKDIIIRGGENISPKEIEEFLYTHENIAEVQVIGVPSRTYGEEVMAWVKLVEGCTLTDDDLKNFCKGQISHYKVPKYWKFVNGFPTTLSGKIRKVEMREISTKELGLTKELENRNAANDEESGVPVNDKAENTTTVKGFKRSRDETVHENLKKINDEERKEIV